jgi:hypothetical protein
LHLIASDLIGRPNLAVREKEGMWSFTIWQDTQLKIKKNNECIMRKTIAASTMESPQ